MHHILVMYYHKEDEGKHFIFVSVIGKQKYVMQYIEGAQTFLGPVP